MLGKHGKPDQEDLISLSDSMESVTEGEEAALSRSEEIIAHEEEEEPLTLIDDEEVGTIAGGIKAFGGADSNMGKGHKNDFQRKVHRSEHGATRCRIFHSKLAATSLEFMESQINDWLDSDDDIDVKDVGHVIGDMTGKKTEPNLIVMVWY
ncbi:MAG: hypothetical protein ACLFUJ_07240 [Phycisphaerae bacterium]